MKLVTFSAHGKTSVGKVVGDQVIDVADAYPGATTMRAILREGAPALAAIDAVQGAGVPLSSVHLMAPVPDPQKFLAIGLNYQDHVDEVVARGGKAPEQQIWFNKNVSCITGPYDGVQSPRASKALDYEGELGVVIGKRCKHVGEADALSVVAGYLVMNDVSARDWQRKTPQWTLGKSFDTHGPCGPWLVTADEVPNPHDLELRVYVNGELRQKMNTGRMVYDIRQQIAELSQVMTLEPGDLIATGTSSGAGFGFNPPKFLKVGDVVRVEIDGIGHIENTVVPEP